MDKNIEIKKRDILNLDILFDSKEELLSLAHEDIELKDKLINNLLLAIKEVIDNNLEKIHFCNVSNYHLKVEIKRDQLKNALKHIIKKYLEIEDFEKCAELQAQIDKL